MAAKQVLGKALAILIEHGWTQGNGFDPKTGSYCLYGALCKAVNDGYPATMAGFHVPKEVEPVLPSLIGCIGEHYLDFACDPSDIPRAWSNIYLWNDAPSRDFEEVEEMLECAIEKAP